MRSGRRSITAPVPAACRPPARWWPIWSTSRASSPPTRSTACRISRSSPISSPIRRCCRSTMSRPPITCACRSPTSRRRPSRSASSTSCRRSASNLRYVSTRGGGRPQRFAGILLEGLAADGGLYVPEGFPKADLARWRGLSYPQLATAILSEFMDDVPELARLVERTYTGRIFGDDEITPLKTLEPGLHLLALSNGPTAAFKDIAMQLLGNLFEGKRLYILGAPSGDTGTAAEYALKGKPGIQVFMLSPHKRMTPFQRAQMYTLQDRNIHNLAVKGVFDDCQDLVKKVNADAKFKDPHRIGSVNSLN